VFWQEEELLRRLKRIEGQVRGLEGMIARRESCRAILTQLAAVEGALERVKQIVRACSLVEGLAEASVLADPLAARSVLAGLFRERPHEAASLRPDAQRPCELRTVETDDDLPVDVRDRDPGLP
jgi:DNA-binding FrmR family transcriptional regulator